jgi:aryl-alcohol dehydrogenase-like predicted oxidoreductase
MGFGNAKSGMHSWTVDEEHSREILKRGLELGVNFFDTAAGYQGGTSEQYLGRALRDFAKRDEVVVATKFFPRSAEEIANGVSGKEHILGLLDRSLTNLGMDYIDLYICHMWDYHTPIEEVMETLNTAVTSGKVRAIGISNCFAWQRLGQICFDSGTLQSAIPRGGTRDGSVLQGSEYCTDTVQPAGFRPPGKKTVGAFQTAAGRYVRKRKV